MAETRIAVCSWSLQASHPDDLADRLERVGVRRAQIALSPVVHVPDRWRGVFVHPGIEVVSGMMAMTGEDYTTLESIARTGGLRQSSRWPEHHAHAEVVAALAAEAEVGLVTFHAGFLPEDDGDPERAIMLDRLRAVADVCADRGLRLGLETGQESAETLAAVLDELERPNVGVNFDPANMILYGKGDPVEALRRLAPRVVQVHVKDAVPTDTPGTWGRETPVGAGAVDWPAFMAVALAIDPPVDFVIEREAGVDRTDDVRAASELVRGHLVGAAR